jgi:hypothetical protein
LGNAYNVTSDLRTPLRAIAAGVCLIASGISNATIINVDFQFQGAGNTYSGQGVLGDSSDTRWNSVGVSGTNLLVADGSGASGVSVSVSGFIGNFANGTQVNPLINDWVCGGGNVMTSTIGGLDANSAFDLAFYNGIYWQDYTVSSQAGLMASRRRSLSDQIYPPDQGKSRNQTRIGYNPVNLSVIQHIALNSIKSAKTAPVGEGMLPIRSYQ